MTFYPGQIVKCSQASNGGYGMYIVHANMQQKAQLPSRNKAKSTLKHFSGACE